MQREREGGEIPIHFSSSSNSFGGIGNFGPHRTMMSSIFGGRDPFDDPFFTRPFSSVYDSSMFGSSASVPDSPRFSKSKEPVIEELNTDDEGEEEEEGGSDSGDGVNKDEVRKNTGGNLNPTIEHPDDQLNEKKNKDVSYSYGNGNNKVGGMKTGARNVSYKRVTYGGINGDYFTATASRRTGSDGIMLEESKQADTTTGQATHRISRGIHGKGHSVMRNLGSDGKVDTMQTLHNLEEEELAGFDQAWKGNADKHLPGWKGGFDYHGNAGTSGSGQSGQATWALPFAKHFRSAGGVRPLNETRTTSGG